MLADRNSRTISQRIDSQALRQSSRLRRLRWQLPLAAFVVTLVIPLAALIRGDHTIYQSGTLSMSHQFIAHDCARCHDTPGQTAWRAVSLNHSARTVSEQACLACHAAPAHHTARLSTRRCAECHREHRGPGELSRIASAFCTECHAELPASASFARSIGSFHSHPEFAVLRKVDDDSIGPRHELLTRAEKDPQTGRWRDKAAIELNHKVHLNPDGIPVRPGAKRGEAAFEQLDCQSCHVPDASAGNFHAIRFDSHCARCHADQLSFLGSEAATLPGVQPVPHREPDIIRGLLRERLSKAAQAAEPAAQPRADKPLRRFFPGVPQPAPLNETQAEAVARQLHLAEGLLFAPRTKDAPRGAGCAYCHEVSRDGEQVQITRPQIPDRWLTHSTFRHDAHRQLACLACHGDAPQSTATADVLLPSIALCRSCHQADDSHSFGRSGSAGAARADCVQCHNYHLHNGQSWDGAHELP
jgi:hypothetical protein